MLKLVIHTAGRAVTLYDVPPSNQLQEWLNSGAYRDGIEPDKWERKLYRRRCAEWLRKAGVVVNLEDDTGFVFSVLTKNENTD